MTKTVQTCSFIILNSADRNIEKRKETARNIKLLNKLSENLNNLCEELNKLNSLIQRKNIELILKRKYTGQIQGGWHKRQNRSGSGKGHSWLNGLVRQPTALSNKSIKPLKWIKTIYWQNKTKNAKFNMNMIVNIKHINFID